MILDGFPRTAVQAAALDRALAERGQRVSAAVLIDVPEEEVMRRMSGRWICRAAGHPVPRGLQPAAHGGRVRHRRLRAVPARRRQAGHRPGAHGPAAGRARRRHRPLPRRRHPHLGRRAPGHRRGGGRHRRRARRRRRSPPRRPPTRGTQGDHPQVEGRDREDAVRRPDRGRGPRADGGAPRAGHLHGRARPDRRAPHPRRGRHPVVPQLPRRPPLRRPRPARLPGVDLHLHRRRDRPRHPGRPPGPRGPDRLDRRRRHLRRLARRRRPQLHLRR